MRFQLSALLPLLCLPALPACGSGTDGYATFYDDGVSSAPASTTIDIGSGLVSDPGLGVGLNVEVAAGGAWKISATCDTPVSDVDCHWDLVASVPRDAGPLEVTDETSFEGDDQTIRVDSGAVRIYMETGADEDFVSLSAPDGADLTLDVILDGLHDSPDILQRVAWVSDGIIRTGAPSNPLQFRPKEP